MVSPIFPREYLRREVGWGDAPSWHVPATLFEGPRIELRRAFLKEWVFTVLSHYGDLSVSAFTVLRGSHLIAYSSCPTES